MSIGNQPTVSNINNSLTSFALQLRDLCQLISNFNLEIGQLGTAGLETVGFNATDAAAVISQAAVLNTIAALYYGTATQASEFNFNNALSPLWAGS